MSITHHPSHQILGRLAAGTLDAGQRLVIEVHAASCPHCRDLLGAFDCIGGEALEAAVPVQMVTDAFERVMARAQTSTPTPPPNQANATETNFEDGLLPPQLRNYAIGKRRRVAPGVSLRPITLPFPSASRVFLLQSAPGTKMLEHTHSGTEFTCVLSGSFTHDKGRYMPGDFDFGDAGVDHEPMVTADGVCICLVAMTGELKPHGWFGRMIAPFIRI